VELREMRAFVVVVEEGSLSAAARRLRLSQPALSQTMAALERQLGMPLLVRRNTGVQATEAGMTLLTEARAVLARHDQALAARCASAFCWSCRPICWPSRSPTSPRPIPARGCRPGTCRPPRRSTHCTPAS
jgi:hypothetical protein